MPTKRIKMPSTIRLAGRAFDIDLLNCKSIGKGILGRYAAKRGKILILEGMSEDQTKSVVLHELFHDLDFQSGFDLTEAQVNSLSSLMFATLRDNPELVAWLMS